MIKFKVHLKDQSILYQYWGKASNLYIIADLEGEATYLVDCGMPSDTDSVAEILNRFPPLRRVVCTHFHVDHVAGWLQLRNRFPNCELWFHLKAKPFVEGKSAIPWPDLKAYLTILLPCMKEYGYVPRLQDSFGGAIYGTPFRKGFPNERVRYFSDGQELLPGFVTLHTPGHRPDETSFFESESGTFIAGDFMLVINNQIKINTFVSSSVQQRASVEKIKQLAGIKTLCPGHGRCTQFRYHLI